MHLLLDESISKVALNTVRESLTEKLGNRKTFQSDQSMAGDALGFLALQVLVPLLVSLCSCALYDILKGRVLAKLRYKEMEPLIEELSGQAADTSVSLKDDCLEVLSNLLTPLGFTDSEITGIYEQMKVTMEAHSKHSLIEK